MRIQLGSKEGRKEEASHRSLVEQVGNWFLTGERKREKEMRRKASEAITTWWIITVVFICSHLVFYLYKAFSRFFFTGFFHVLSFLFIMTWLHCSFSLHK